MSKIISIERYQYQKLKKRLQDIKSQYVCLALSDKLIKEIELAIKSLYFEYISEWIQLQTIVDYDAQSIRFDSDIKFNIHQTIPVDL